METGKLYYLGAEYTVRTSLFSFDTFTGILDLNDEGFILVDANGTWCNFDHTAVVESCK